MDLGNLEGMDKNIMESMMKGMMGGDMPTNQRPQQDADVQDRIENPLDLDPSMPSFQPVIRHLTPRQIEVFRFYFEDLISLYPEGSEVSDDVIDTVGCLFRMKKDCGEYLVEGYELMQDMVDWFKMKVEILPAPSQEMRTEQRRSMLTPHTLLESYDKVIK